MIEHLEPPYLAETLSLAYDKLRPGARIVLETINPACWVAFFESFIRDLTHVKPIHPETLQYMLQASGFSNVEIVYRAPIAEGGKLRRVEPLPEYFGNTAPDALTELVSSFNSNVDHLNGRLFSYQDFAAIATKYAAVGEHRQTRAIRALQVVNVFRVPSVLLRVLGAFGLEASAADPASDRARAVRDVGHVIPGRRRRRSAVPADHVDDVDLRRVLRRTRAVVIRHHVHRRIVRIAALAVIGPAGVVGAQRVDHEIHELP